MIRLDPRKKLFSSGGWVGVGVGWGGVESIGGGEISSWKRKIIFLGNVLCFHQYLYRI